MFSCARGRWSSVARPVNVFALGLDERNLALLQELVHPRPYRFHALLEKAELMHEGDLPLPELLDEAHRRLQAFDGTIDAIIGYWDFPVSSMVPILCTHYGLTGASLESVVKCEHKYWSRLEQRKVTNAHPAFDLIDLCGDPQQPPGLRYPMWIKPVKSYSSALAFRVATDAEFEHALTEIREGVHDIGKAFDFLLGMLELPPEIAAAGGQACCLAEEEISGRQATVEGYCYRDRPHVYGIVDSVNYPGTSSFLRYQYPSRLPAEVQERMAAISAKVITQIGLANSTFNIEFFWDRETAGTNTSFI
jgi:hypothetical protein